MAHTPKTKILIWIVVSALLTDISFMAGRAIYRSREKIAFLTVKEISITEDFGSIEYRNEEARRGDAYAAESVLKCGAKNFDIINATEGMSYIQIALDQKIEGISQCLSSVSGIQMWIENGVPTRSFKLD